MAALGGTIVLTCAVIVWCLIRGLFHLRRIADAAGRISVAAARIMMAVEDVAENTTSPPDPWTALQETKRHWRGRAEARRAQTQRGTVPSGTGQAGER